MDETKANLSVGLSAMCRWGRYSRDEKIDN